MQAALASGREADGLLYAYALAVAEPEKGKEILQKYRWFGGLKRPALAARWGIGVVYTKPANFSGSPMPIGSKQNIPQRRPRTGRGGDGGVPGGELGVPGGYDGGAGIPGMPGQFGGAGGGAGGGFKTLTGELGDKTIERLAGRLERSYYGELLKSVPRSGRGNMAGGGAPGVPGGDAGYAPGAGGIPGIPGGDAGYAPGAGGIPGMPGDPGGGGYGGPGGGAGAGSSSQLLPGVTYLGEGPGDRELVRQAADAGLHALLVFDIKVSKNPKNNLVYNDTQIELYNVATGERIASTKVLKNVEIQMERDQGKDNDTVGKELDKIFEVADLGYRATDLPAGLLPEHVQRRVGALTAEADGNPLWILSEMRFFHSKQLLSDSDMQTAMKELVGDETAQILASGSAEDRQKAIQKWLPGGTAAAPQNAPSQRPFR